ncbi:hypothetical protein K4F52_000417 [Lecanicillium sp. MT-2017a]|nr:hypothetical protein K4F52_000417 [Lecanicillium sp. MT-2017a]
MPKEAISLLLSSIKGIRMAGLSEISREAITAIRAGELDAAGGFRLGISIIVLVAFTPEFITPVACFTIYMLTSENGSGFDITRAFVSLALMMMLAEPLSRLLQMSPAFIEAHNCLERIEKFLLLPTHKETRCFIESDLQGRGTSTVTQSNETQRGSSTQGTPMREMGNNLVIIENGEFYWSFDSPVLRNVNIEIPKSAITLAIGSVASGKSTFCKALLGEVPQSGGNIYLDASLARIGYCDQTPYLTNGTVQQNIIGHGTLHKPWYNTVVDALTLIDDFETFPEGDQTLIGSSGIALSSGQRQRVALARAVYTQNEFLVLDDVFSAMDTITKKRIFTKLFGPDGLLRKSKTTVVVVGHDQQLPQIADHIILFKKGEPPDSRAPQAELDAKFLEEDGERTSSVDITKADGREDEGKTKATTPDSETATSSSGWSVYKYYCATVGWFNVFLLILYGAIYATFTSFPTLWLSWWTSGIGHSDSYYLSVYAILQASGLISSFLFIRHCLVATVASSGRILHRRLLSAVMQATMPFLSKTDSGVLLNRFSQDFNYIDDELPRAVMNIIMAPLVGAGHLILVATPSGWMSLSYPILFAILYWLSKFYIRTSQQLRPMCLEYKSPLYAHFLDTTRGLVTIRAFGWTQASIEVQHQLLDTSNRPSYALGMSQCFLGLSQSVISLGMAVFLTTVAFKSGANQGLTAVALVNLNQFTTCIGGIFWSWTSLETSITAVSRVKDFCEKTPREGTEGVLVDKYTEDNWPSAGGIECRDLVASYGADAEEMALKGVNLTIQPGERIGICGRSGSGKSTFLTSLLRLVDIRRGGVSIDGIDIRSVQLSSLRSRINAIPQDPFFLPGTFRSNISPYETSSDGAIEEALRRVHLWDKVEQSGGLDGELKPDEMSQGEKRLFSMARAILRRDCKIVMLDEVSSSLDFETEKLIVQVLKEAFQGCTIIAIAHRLETIIDFDRVAVFADGNVIECDAPDKLLEKPNSAFAKLRAAGQS